MRHLFIAMAALLLASCSASNPPAPISANPTQDALAALPPSPAQTTVVQGLQDASYNLDSAVTVGALSASDPAPACLHSALTQLGISTPGNTVTPAASFVPKVSDLISAGAVLYIRAQQAQALIASGGIQVSVPCEALIGKLVMDAGKATAAGTIIGGSIAAQSVGLP